LIEHELKLRPPSAKDLLQSLSDAAFSLGLVVLQADSSSSAASGADAADALGMLDGIEAIASSMLRLAPSSNRRPVAAAFRVVREKSAVFHGAFDQLGRTRLVKRADLVLASGSLGVALRRFAGKLNVELELPYEVRRPVAGNTISEPVNVFSVPAALRGAPAVELKSLADLGRRAFVDRRLSANGKRACTDCHIPNKAFGGARSAPAGKPGAEKRSRDVPTLLYSWLHAVRPWDGQFPRDAATMLMQSHAASTLGLSGTELVDKAKGIAAYRTRLARLAPAGRGATQLVRALAAFAQRDLLPASSPFDRFSRGDKGALSSAQQAGLEVFFGAGRCGRCHIPPLFGGARPPIFTAAVFAVLGVPVTPTDNALDPDEGRGLLSGRPLDNGAFRVPTLRNLALTAPYFHHGGFPTLDAVIDFLDKGGGKGLGLEVLNQDWRLGKLALSEQQRAALLVFLREGLLDEAIPLATQRTSELVALPNPP